MHQTAVLNIVGLTASLLGSATPRLQAFAGAGEIRRMRPLLPAVTCAAQASMLTGRTVREHGIVGNGWFDRELNEVHFWKQSNRLVRGPKVWETARERAADVTCANMFWWYNMYSSVDYAVTPRPMYRADGRKIPDVHTHPPELRDDLQQRLGRFPLFNFWGPLASIASSEWIAEASLDVHERFSPTLMLVYLPHLDYCLQQHGPGHAAVDAELARIDAVAGRLIDELAERDTRVLIVSEYGIEGVTDAVHVNRILRSDGLLRVRDEQGHEQLDAGASDAFVVADHQVAHVYVRVSEAVPRIAERLAAIDGVDLVLDRARQRELALDADRAGDIVLVAERGRWFSYDYWLDDERAPDFARTVDIHRKPGYDPLELFIDPQLRAPKLRIAGKLARRALGFRTLLDVIPLDTSLVRGSHGRMVEDPDLHPLLMTRSRPLPDAPVELTAVHDVILDHLFG